MRILKTANRLGIFKRESIYLIMAGLLSAVMLITTYIHAGKRFSEFLPLMDNFMIAKNAVAKAYLFSEKMSVSDETVSKEVVIGLINGAELSVDDAINGRSAIAGTSAIRIADKELLRNLGALKNAVVKFRLVTEELMEDGAQNRHKLRVDQRSAFYEIDFFAATSESTIRKLMDMTAKKQLLFFVSTLVLWTVFAMTLISMYLITRSRKEAEISRLNAELEARVEQRTHELKAANEELESFSYSISHDLRAPLRAIEGYSAMVVEDYSQSLDDEGRRFISVIRANAQKMGDLIDDMLAFSRLSRNEIRMQTVDMRELAESVVQELATPEISAKVNISVGAMDKVFGDASMLRQVWMNLISNAIKFTLPKEGGVIEAGSGIRDNQRFFFVKDNGVGFDMKYSSKLFNVFQRLHSQQDFEGTGVGLAIVRRIVERHGGRVSAEAMPDEGATFSFTIPSEAQEAVDGSR